MQPRIDNPAVTVPGVLPRCRGWARPPKVRRARDHPVPRRAAREPDQRLQRVRGYALARARGCRRADERIFTVAAWREAPYFSDAERAALALTEAATRLADSPDAVSDEVWEDAARHYDEPQLAALVVAIAMINVWNRLNATTRQITGEWVGEWIAPSQSAGQAA